MSDIVIKVENISKLYHLGQIGTGTLTEDLNRWWARVRGKEDPNLKIGEVNKLATKAKDGKGSDGLIWALKDINFEVKQGEVLGIIGRNGAGKSTLLKILSQVTTPTTGVINVKGRIASLLEVGTGFHPDLTGRENIYLNGGILGMTKAEIRRKFDEIVSFSGVERHIDTPVKRYSSGMYVRLAFAVAAHLESEILIVDEVLAVGDADFQKKCLGKMGELSKGEGRTVLFVSHNMAAVKELCDKGILILNGTISEIGAIQYVVEKYIHEQRTTLKSHYNYIEDHRFIGDAYTHLLGLHLIDRNNQALEYIYISTEFGVLIEYEIINDSFRPDLTVFISTMDGEGVFHSVHKTNCYKKGVHNWVVWIPSNLMNNLEYILCLGITTLNPVTIHIQHYIRFEIYEDLSTESRSSDYTGKIHGVVRPQLVWENLI